MSNTEIKILSDRRFLLFNSPTNMISKVNFSKGKGLLTSHESILELQFLLFIHVCLFFFDFKELVETLFTELEQGLSEFTELDGADRELFASQREL